MFASPTVAELARNLEIAIQKAPIPQVPPIQAVTRNQKLPLSFNQQQLWLLSQLAPNTPFYNEPFTIHLPGSVNIAALERSISEIIKRHESLRTRFIANRQPVMVIQDAYNFNLPFVDLGELPPEAERETEALRLASVEAKQPFDFTSGPILRGTLIQLSEEDCRLFLTIHHIIIDGISIYSIFLTELAEFYTAFSSGLPRSYQNYHSICGLCLWQRQWLEGEMLESQLVTGNNN